MTSRRCLEEHDLLPSRTASRTRHLNPGQTASRNVIDPPPAGSDNLSRLFVRLHPSKSFTNCPSSHLQLSTSVLIRPV
ncbi:unnamed protein product [Protopolystoma xenopodis]|uniref:Uncharacterized protein n=1 Tax=Protopolystoma xenopodis TaxID=117903 RepID=A0A3S5CEC9_9PLAT|nr:unnamed protein product [Protopolystoma xenopodis]